VKGRRLVLHGTDTDQSCGDLLYGDYLERKPGSLQSLAAQLGGRIISGPAIHQAPVNSPLPPPRLPPQAHSKGASGTLSSSGSVGGPSNILKPLQDGQSPTSASGRTGSAMLQHNTSSKWLEICIRSSADISILAEIYIAGEHTDKTVFDAIKHHYQMNKPSARFLGRFAYRVTNGGCSVMVRNLLQSPCAALFTSCIEIRTLTIFWSAVPKRQASI